MSERNVLCAVSEPDWKDHVIPLPLPIALPSCWHGMAIEWHSQYAPPPVFIAQFVLPTIQTATDVYLFGVRFDTVRATVKGRALPDGHFLEFFVVECTQAGQVVHCLAQNRSVTYSACACRNDYLEASELTENEVGSLSIYGKPRWKVEDAVWPSQNGKPMCFVGQAELPENDVTKEALTWDAAVFLFWAESVNSSVFKTTMQDLDYQSAEDHYSQES